MVASQLLIGGENGVPRENSRLTQQVTGNFLKILLNLANKDTRGQPKLKKVLCLEPSGMLLVSLHYDDEMNDENDMQHEYCRIGN